MKIKYLSPVFCQVRKEDIPLMKDSLRYKSYWFKRNRWGGGETKESISYFMDRKRGLFLCGFLPRVIQHCKNQNLFIEIEPEEKYDLPEKDHPEISGIAFRPYQIDLIQKATAKQRGVIVSPTGSGKTVIAMGIMSMFPKRRILFLCHSLSILKQTYDELIKFKFKDVGFVGEGKKDVSSRIVVASIKSMVSIPLKKQFDITIIDEVHHLSGTDTQYFKFMLQNESPIRIGFTATLPEKEEARMTIEGCLGPIIGEFKSEDGIREGFTAKPFITLVSVSPMSQISELKRYSDIYQKGIVENRVRNRLILSLCASRIREGKSVLVLVKEIEHGEILQEMGKEIFQMEHLFIQGSTEGNVREQVRKALIKKKIKMVICTAVWKEGVDVPSLDCVINASSGKSEIATLQVIGRGSRKTKTKSKVEIVDFLDPYKYLSQHAIIRLSIYVKQNWL